MKEKQEVKQEQENEKLVYDEAIKAYQESVTNLKWAIGIILGIMIVFGAYIIFQDRKEYKVAVNNAKEASDKAEYYRDEAQSQLSKLTQEGEQVITRINEIKKEAIESIRQQGREELEKLRKDTDAYKTNLQDQIIEKAKQGEISDDDAVKLSEMIERAYSSDLKEFLKKGIRTPNDIKYSLTECRTGIYSSETVSGGRIGGGTQYKLTKHGKMLYEIINGKSF